MNVAVDGGLNVRVPYDRLNGLHRRSGIIQQGCVGVAEDVGRSPVEVDGAPYTLFYWVGGAGDPDKTLRGARSKEKRRDNALRFYTSIKEVW